MSWLSSIGHKIGQVATNPWVQGGLAGALALTGVGAPAAAGILAANKGVGNLIKPGGNLKGAATGAAQGALTGGLASGGTGLIKKAIPLALSHLGGGGGSAPGGGSEADPYGDGRPGEFNPGGGGLSLGGLVRGAGGLIKDAAGNLVHAAGGGGNLLDLGLGGLAAANAAKLQGQSDKYATGALDTAKESYAARAPLRLAGVEGMLHPEAGNVNKLAALKANTGVGNPFNRKPLPLAGVG